MPSYIVVYGQCIIVSIWLDEQILYMRPVLGKQVLSTQNTCVCIMVRISSSVCTLQTLLVLLNSSWISLDMMIF